MRRGNRRPVAGALVQITCLLACITLGAAIAQAGVTRVTYDFTAPTLTAAGGSVRVEMEEAWSHGDPGAPVLPLAGARILLPPGETVTDVQVIPGARIELPGSHAVAVGQPQMPLSHTGPVAAVPADPEIYESDRAYPGRLHDAVQTGMMRGHRIATLALHPVEYVPASGTLAYYRSLEVVLTTAPSGAAMRETARMIRTDAGTQARVAALIDNPERIGAYEPILRLRDEDSRLDPAEAYTYLIIAGDDWVDAVDPLVQFQTARGHKAGVFSRSWIVSNYPAGQDDQWRIRDFIIDAYQTWDVEYVLLVGDANDSGGIPHRGFYAYAYGETDSNIPADLYYGCLDGTWNDDGDGRWGEEGEDDLYFEIGVGRACVTDAGEMENFITKTLRYTDEPIVAECDEALMVGELLWSSPLTWGGTYKDEIKDGSSANGYTTVGFIPGPMNVGTLYDRDATWSKTTLINMMESGLNIVNHLGHCNTDYAMKMYLSDIPSFDNDGTEHSYNFVYSQGCYCGAFDSNSFAEEFQTDDDGAAALVMNSRYGWGDPGGTNGSSQYFDREFFDAIFDEQIYPLADVNDDSRMDVIWAIDFGANRWCYYQLNLFGDPAMHLWTEDPVALNVSYPDVVLIGVPEYEVTVYGGGGPVAGARVTAYTADFGVYATGVTDATGAVTLLVEPQEPGTLYLKVTAHDYLTFNGETPIIPPDGPYISVGDRILDDDLADDSAGNADGDCDAGETLELLLGLRNVGIETATNVRATISSEDGHVEILDAYEEYGDIAPDEQGFCIDDFEFHISPACPDGHLLAFDVLVESDNRMVWEKEFNLLVEAPVLELGAVSVMDAAGGDGDGLAEPGETVQLLPMLCNTGSEDATGLAIHLHVYSQYVTIDQGMATLDLLPAGGEAPPATAFEVTIAPECPEPDILCGCLVINADWEQTASPTFDLPVGGFWDDMESGYGLWTHYIVTGGFVDQWHQSTQRNYTPGGATSWKFGDTGSGDYTNLADGALETEPVALRNQCYLRFRHWMEAETSGAYPDYCYDGGLVEMSVDGAPWEQITPVGGYPYLVREGSTPGPFPAETPVYSGNIDWAAATFELVGYAGEARFRFRFGSDGADTREGWYIDDVSFSGTQLDPSDGGEATPLVLRPAIDQNRPNPFGNQTMISYRLPARSDVRLEIFDPSGRLLRTLQDGSVDAGSYVVTWDGRDARGVALGSGVYFYQFRADGIDVTRKLILTR
ncbi:MAG: T9SS type A sorting domain-containing protein [Candidatus Eisenbacteria bacterium]|nr:T9SS type A sorting domain-containing protein [Candidatus Eisenbacteria bacterium]